MQTLNLQARDGEINDAFLHDLQGDLGAGRDLGGEGQAGGDGYAGAGLDLYGEGLNINVVDCSHAGVGSIWGKIFRF